MNYFNPYLYMNTPTTMTSNGLLGLFRGVRGLNLGTILNGTQRTLSIINQAIPVVKQMSPLVKNAKTMFRVMNEFKKVDTKDIIKTRPVENATNEYTPINNDGGPQFFI